MMSKETLISQARKFDYKPENYEKVYKLLFVLEQFMSVPYLKDRLVLKGGTALIEQQRAPTQHAGGKNVWKYDSALGQKGNLEIDLNYMFRNPLWPIIELESKLSFSNSLKVPVLDIHELASGKLSALFARKVSRDFFDAHYLLTKCNLSKSKLRETFVVYAAFSTSLVEDVSIKSVQYDVIDIRNKLFPVLKQKETSRKKIHIEKWANQLLSELRGSLSIILPLQKNELDFIRLIREQGEIKPELITDNESLIESILMHPLLKWNAMKVHMKK